MQQKLLIASDHGGVKLKKELIKRLKSDCEVKDLGTNDKSAVDYPDYAKKVAKQVASEPGSKGILICRSGVGMSMAANKVDNVRAALAYNPLIATLSRQHNNANVICFGADFISIEDAYKATDNFIKTDFEGGRHQRRVDKIG